ncbi:MAG: hypothetical protein QM690_11740 [Sphingobium sp.]
MLPGLVPAYAQSRNVTQSTRTLTPSLRNDAAQLPSPDQVQRRQSLAAASASNIADLSSAISSACEIQPWQFILRKSSVGGNTVQLETSPTLSGGSRSCIQKVIAKSRFTLVRAP